jgi:hypothetical protein
VPHAEHFLERLDRVPRSLTDFALELYRDPGRVRWIVHCAHLPESEKRVALALGPHGEGPYLVVTRDGHFVTALGAEMTPNDLPVLSRAQVDIFSNRALDARSRFELARDIVPPGMEPADVLNLLETRAWAITREELTALSAWSPLFAGRFLSDLYGGLDELDSVRRNYLTRHDKEYRNDPDVRSALFNVWNTTFAIGTRLVLAAMGDLTVTETKGRDWQLPVGPTFPATAERILAVTMRGAWAAARMGRPFIPAYKRILSTPVDPKARIDAAIAMSAIGLRHARYRDDARRYIGALVDTPGARDRPLAEFVVAACHRVLDDPEGATRDAIAHGAALLVLHGDLLPEGSPYKYAQAADVPRDIALLVGANGLQESFDEVTFDLLPWVAGLASAEELYYPRDMARALNIEWTPDLIEQVYARHLGAKHEPVVSRASRVGRNEPCSCGSGKKFKKCCGR